MTTMALISFFILSISLILTECQNLRYITTSPQNVAVRQGETTQLNCVSNLSTTFDWTVSPIGQALFSVIRGCQLNPSYVGIYDINQDDPGSCNIVVLNATVDQAGLYICHETTGFDPIQTAQLVLLGADPDCRILFNEGNTSDVVENEFIQMRCTVNYTTNLSPLDTIWTDQNGQPIAPTTETTPDGTFQSYIQLTAPSDLVEAYSALTYFLPLSSNPPSTATNTPSFTHNWTFPMIYVSYCPNDISIFPSSDIILGDALVCSANGYPFPSFHWIDLGTNTTIDGYNVTMTSLGLYSYQCTAFNSIRNNDCSIFTTVNINVFGYVPPENIAAQSGQTITIKCTHRYQDILWLFSAFGSAVSVAIAANCNVLAIYSSKYSVDKSNNNCDLIVLNVDSTQAGTYTCQDPFSTDVPLPPAAELIVIDSAPDCFIRPNFTEECETRISCRVKYTGNLTPMMSWTDHNGQPVTNYTYIFDENEVYSYIDVSGSMVDGSFILESFTCDTYFDVPPTTPPGGQTNPATNAPDYRFPWNSPTAFCNNTHSERILVQQNNIDASNAFFFNRNWAEYTEGFGSTETNGSYWIGLETLHKLTNSGRDCIARFDILDIDTNTWYWAEYNEFVVDGNDTDYILHSGGYSGNAGNAMRYINAVRFATYDHNNGNIFPGIVFGGFWFGFDSDVCINCSPNYNFIWWDYFGDSTSPCRFTCYLQISRLWLFC